MQKDIAVLYKFSVYDL